MSSRLVAASLGLASRGEPIGGQEYDTRRETQENKEELVLALTQAQWKLPVVDAWSCAIDRESSATSRPNYVFEPNPEDSYCSASVRVQSLGPACS